MFVIWAMIALMIVAMLCFALMPLAAKFDAAHPELTFGPLYPAVICPHCRVKGQVRIKERKVNGGISGAKAAGAVLTGGASVLVTGLSKKSEGVSEAHCGNCQVSWRL